jgi:multiple sugar transport system permease protein
MGEARRKLVRSVICWLLLSPLIIVILFPFAVMFLTAVKPGDEVLSARTTWLPSRFAWENFAEMWRAIDFGTALLNSLYVSAAATVVALLVAVPAAYAMSRYRFAGRDAYRDFLLITQMLSPIVLVSYFATIPRDLEEAAWLEGASRLRTVIRVFLPLAAPAMTVTAIFTFINSWNEFAVALSLLRSPDTHTLPIKVFSQVAGRYSIQWHHVMAATLLATVPVSIVFAWMQRYLVRGLALGAVK